MIDYERKETKRDWSRRAVTLTLKKASWNCKTKTEGI